MLRVTGGCWKVDFVGSRSWLLGGMRVFGYIVVAVENPDDAAEEENTGTGVTTPWLCIFQAQFGNPGEEVASTFAIAPSCTLTIRNIPIMLQLQ